MFKGIVGIECGGKNSVLSKIGRTGLETIQSESSSREIPCAVVFTETQRLFAEVAQDRIKAYYQQSITYLFRLCAAEEVKRGYHSFQISADTNKPVIQNEQFEVEQFVGSFLTYLDSLIKNHLPINDSYVCAVSAPNYFTLEDKHRLQVACKIARLPCLGVISEHVAVGYSYLWFSKKDLAENARRVMFIDFGDTQSSCFVYKFENHVGILEDLAVCRDLGVRDIDQAIYSFLQSKYAQAMQNISKKSELRVKEQIARTRKELSSNTESQFIVESVSGDHDLQHLFTREQLLKIVEENGLITKLRELIGKIGNIEGLDDIELLGGGSRIPVVQQTIKDALKTDKLGVTFQSCETVSRGCAIACAVAAKSLNPLIKIEPYQIKGKLQENLSVELIVQGEVKVRKAYRKGQETPLSSSLSVILKGNENAEQVNVRFKEINEGEMEIIEKEVKSCEDKEVPITETNEMVIEGEKETTDVNAMDVEEQEKKENTTEVTGDSNNQNTENAALDDKPDGVRILVDYWISESGIGGVRDARQLVDQKGWQGLKVEIESIVTEEKLMAMQVKEKEFKDRDASVRQVLEERNTLEAYLNSKLRYVRETLQFKVSEELSKTVETQLQGIEEEYLSIQDQIGSEQIRDMLKRAKAAMDTIEVTLKNNKKISFSANSISDVEVFVKGYKKAQRVQVDEFELKIAGQAIGDGKGIFGMFKKSGAQKLKQALECLQINQSLNLQLGDNNLSENGLSEIFNGIETNGISEVSLELDSTAAGRKNMNKITDEGLVNILQEFLTRAKSLTLLSLTLNTPSKDLQILLDIIPSTLNSLKHLNLTLTNFTHDQQSKTQLENGLLPRSHTLTLNCITPNGTLFH